MRSIIVFTVIACALLLGCESTPLVITKEYNVDVLLPLAIGNKWIGDTRIFNGDGSLARTTSDTTAVTGDTMINGERWFRYAGSSLMINRAGGLFQWINPTIGTTAPTMLFSYPPIVGDVTRGSTSLGASTTTLVSTSEVVVVDGQVHVCCHYRMMIEGYRNEIHMYLEPGRGWIKRETKMFDKGTFYTFELWEIDSATVL